MCGIAGILDPKSLSDVSQLLPRMNDVAIHRGPDSSGVVYFNRQNCAVGEPSNENIKDNFLVGLAHRRLSIIDLSNAGHQPMVDRTGRFWIVYNGEVYNYIELRHELEQAGYQFTSHSDTEVILNAYIHWGVDCFSKFNGMWALAVYDKQEQQLVCSRDRFGVKPFHYAIQPGRFAFASEIKQLLELPWVDRKANHDRLGDFFIWGFETHTNETFFQNIHCLPPSTYAELTFERIRSGIVKPQTYWEPTPCHSTSPKEAIARFGEIFTDGVRLRLRSDVPVGVTLSGGLDSSSVVCTAGIIHRENKIAESLKSFNVDFQLPGYSEREFAEAAAAKAGATSVVLHPGTVDLEKDWEHFLWHMECPIGSLSYFSNFQIYRLIHQHGIVVVLTGQGGDELLLGYERYRTFEILFRLRSFRWLSAIREMISARKRANMSFEKQLKQGIYFTAPNLRVARRRKLVRPILNRDFYDSRSINTEHVHQSMNHNDRFSLQQSEYSHYQLPHLLHHEDRVSMAHSIETRLPFLDYRLFEFILGQNTDLLFRDGWSKYILRQSMRGIIPEKIQQRTDKMGYETPTGSLIRNNRKLFMDLLNRQRNDPVLNVDYLIKHFDSPKINERLLCGSVSYLTWKEIFAVNV